MRPALASFACALAAVSGAAGSPLPAECPLVEAAAELGVRFRHDSGRSPARHLPETMGSGLAWIDYDGDGWQDLYLVQSGPFPPPVEPSPAARNRLFRNLDGRGFEEVRLAAGAADDGYGQGVVAADVDGDGAVDLLVTNYGPDVLWRNDGRGAFSRAPEAGIDSDGWSSSAAFGDVDGDGDLDLYVTGYVLYEPDHGIFCADEDSGERRYCDPSLFVGAPDRLFRNRGDGVFEDVSVEAGIAPADGRGLGVVIVDLDGDRRPEIYVANDLNLNFLFRDRGEGRFEETGLLAGVAVNAEGKAEAGMGIAVADVDGDLAPDLAVTNFDVETNTLYVNRGDLFFEDVSTASGLGLPSFNRLAFGIAAADFDGDGDLDLVVANGHVFERPHRPEVTYEQPDQLFLSDGRGGFREVDCPALAADPQVGRGLAVADLDNDGAPEVGIQSKDGPLRLYANRSPEVPWIGVRLSGAPGNGEGVGARLVLETDGRPQARWVLAGDSYQSSSDRRSLFRLGEGGSPRSLVVEWPSGRTTRIASPPTGGYLTIHEP